MADLTQTAANVAAGSGAQKNTGTAGEGLVGGEPLYLKPSDNKLYKGKANATAIEAAIVGIALHPTNINQPVQYQLPGKLMNVGATLVRGAVYVVSATTGKIAPITDLVGTNFITVLGIAADANNLDQSVFKATGYQV